MKKILLSMACLMAVLALSAQSTAKKFVLNLTADGESNLTCYLPQNPSGRAVVDCPGGGYSHLALNHEGYDWAEYFNKQGIAFFVLKYRMPHGRHTVPMEDACKAMRTVRDSASVWNINVRMWVLWASRLEVIWLLPSALWQNTMLAPTSPSCSILSSR